MYITTSNNIEGYTIIEYIDVITESVVIGTGFVSSINASLADLTGGQSKSYANKLEIGKDAALRRIKSKAQEMGGNGIIGIDIDYTVFVGDLMGVTICGTVVCVEKNKKPDTTITYSYPSALYNVTLPYNICELRLSYDYAFKTLLANLLIKNYGTQLVTALVADIEIKNIFADKFLISDLVFVWRENEYTSMLESYSQNVDISNFSIRFDTIKSVFVYVKKYIVDNNSDVIDVDTSHNIIEESIAGKEIQSIRKNQGTDVVTSCKFNETTWQCYCGEINDIEILECSRCKRNMDNKKKFILSHYNSDSVGIEELLKMVQQKNNAKEVYEYIRDLEIPELEELLNELKELAELERLYGGMKMSAIQKVNQYFKQSKT